MDSLTFTSNVIDSLAWPVAIVVSVLLLRDPLGRLIPLLRRFKYKGLELEFGDEIRELRKTVARELAPAEDERSVGTRGRLSQLAEISPRAAVLESWLEVETAGVDALRRHGLDLSTRHWTWINALVSAEFIDRERVHQIRELRALRNRAVHAEDFELSVATALEYSEAALLLASHLRTV